MMRINREFVSEIEKFGGFDFTACYNCGNCTAVCPLVEENSSFPRRMLRYTVLGLEEEIQSSVDPWLCYYCGDCSETCPRQSNPGEIMMALRRYLTSAYDWTGFSKKLYTSKMWKFGAISLLSTLVIALFFFFLPPTADPAGLINADGGVKINSFVKGMDSETFVKVIEIADWIMAAFVSFFLLSNILNMFIRLVIKNKKVKVPLYLYVKEAWALFYHFGTQIRLLKCKDKTFWAIHWLLMSGYIIMFSCIVLILPWFQTEQVHPIMHPQRLLGYYASFGLLLAIIVWSIQRIKKGSEKHKYSHPTDWLFLGMLFLTALTGILVHVFRISGMIYPTYYMYVIHLAILFPMIMLEVPFSKWSHLAYRPFAIYCSNLVNSAMALKKKP